MLLICREDACDTILNSVTKIVGEENMGEYKKWRADKSKQILLLFDGFDEIKNDKNIENLIITLEVRSSLVVCEAIIKSAFMRKESRGAHFRSDFPTINNDEWHVNIYCTKVGGKMILYKQNVKEVKGILKEVIRDHSKPIHNNESE